MLAHKQVLWQTLLKIVIASVILTLLLPYSAPTNVQAQVPKPPPFDPTRLAFEALTAHALEEERREILPAGCDDFIRKPYRHADVHDALTRNLGVRFVYEEETPPADVALPLNTAAMADLPDELLNELEQALVRCDIDAVSRALEAIRRPHHPSQADALAAVARDLQFGRILRMIRAASGEAGPETRHA